jgi:hypothetical protein
VDAGKIAVQYDDVVTGGCNMAERGVPVEDHIDGHALAAKPVADRTG